MDLTISEWLQKGRLFFISDTHFSHYNILTYCPNRVFKSIEEHDETLIYNWNNTVTNEDTVFHLGDFGFGHPKKLQAILSTLNGKKILVSGNHDRRLLKDKEFVATWDSILHGVYEITYKGYLLVLSHFPLETWSTNTNVIHAHGHCHSTQDKLKLYYIPNRIDVGVDLIGLTPIVFEDLVVKVNELNQQFYRSN